ncbi:Protein of unknown function DUF4228 [Cynara cardunculus var. scolymus]|uniref:Uncharacterized protein n=1 Tax=Cynara cardunculus var. scolymus TaxID=59895 RepID=A0A103XYB5_CYNCS|nr:Protein of unknown function DUF4228 [Cynara cardunculus var. scolymus]
MGIGSWIYTNSTKNLRVKIVHPGGHAELHDRPVLVAEVIRRNPRCCVAHPNVFKQPWAIVQPDIMLMPGQKVYIVPISTIRKLQKLAIKRSLSSGQETREHQSFKQERKDGEEDDDGNSETSCCSMEDGNGVCVKSFKGGNGSSEGKSCFTCVFTGSKRRSETGSTSNSSNGDRGNRNKGESPKKLITSLDYWQPNLHSIVEERSIPE